MRVILLPEVLEYFESLAEILYQKQYLSFEETAQKYVGKLYIDITSNLGKTPHHPSPAHLDWFVAGMYHAKFRRNRHTTWYVFFTRYNDNGDTVCLVRYVANNHTVAQLL